MEEITKDILDSLSPEELLKLEELFDPVSWCENNLSNPENPYIKFSLHTPGDERPYQADILKFQPIIDHYDINGKPIYIHRSKIMRFGRRCCGSDSTLVMLSNGTYKKIKDIVPGDIIVSRDENNKVISQKILEVFNNGIKDVYKISFSNGRELICTSDHKILVKDGSGHNIKRKSKISWKSIDDGLCKTDHVFILDKYEVFGNLNVPDEAKLLGYMMTDGHLGLNATPQFNNTNYLYISEIKDIYKKMYNYNCKIHVSKEGIDKRGIHHKEAYIITLDKQFKKFAKELNILGLKSENRKILDRVYKYNRESLALFLNRLWSGDGCVSLWQTKNRPNGKRIELSLTSGNLEFLKELRPLLYKIGVDSKIKKDRKIGNGYKLYFSDYKSVTNFLNFVGLIYGKEKQSKEALIEIEKRARKQCLYKEGDFYLYPIKSIEKYGKDEVYDLTVESTHNFLVDGIVVHNCGKTVIMGAEALYKACSESNFRIIYVGPFENQCNLFFNILEKLLQNSGIKPKSYRKKPYQMIFNNGSYIRGFTANVSSSSKGSSLRGQEADHICFVAGTNIHEDYYTIRNIENVTKNQNILGFEGKPYLGQVAKLITTQKAKVMKLTHYLGEVICTPDHPIFEYTKDISAQNAKVVNFRKNFRKTSFDDDLIEARILGYTLFNSTFKKDRAIINVNNKNIRQIANDIKKVYGRSITNHFDNVDELKSEYVYNLYTKITYGNEIEVDSYTRLHNLISYITGQTKDYKKEFLSGLFSYCLNTIDLIPKDGKMIPTAPKIFLTLKNCDEVKYEMIESLLKEFNIGIDSKIQNMNEVIILLNSLKEITNPLFEIGTVYNIDNQEKINIAKLCSYFPDLSVKQVNDKFTIIQNYFTLPILNKEMLKDKQTVYNITTDNFARHRYHANGIIVHNCLDEMDFGMDEVIDEIILPIFNGNPKSSITAASTPSGRRGTFYKWNMNPEIIQGKVFHVPSSASPKWNEQSELAAKRSSTHNAYVHEYLAEFGEEESGVFNKTDIDFCTIQTEHPTLQEYYDSLEYNSNNTYIMGVDWNQKYGVSIVIVERDLFTHKYRVFRHEVIEKSELTQTKGVERILNIHRYICHCQYIFVDMGFGQMQYETLKHTSDTDLSLGLKDRVIGINFSSKLEYLDPIERIIVDKPAKPFMVENAQKIMEERNMEFNELESREKGLIDQISKYNFKSVDGKVPTYEGYDHSLDAWMLALLGYRLKYEIKDFKDQAPKAVPLIQSHNVSVPQNLYSNDRNIFKKALRTRYGLQPIRRRSF